MTREQLLDILREAAVVNGQKRKDLLKDFTEITDVIADSPSTIAVLSKATNLQNFWAGYVTGREQERMKHAENQSRSTSTSAS